MNGYHDLEDVLSKALPEPDVCDSLAVVYRGVTLHVYGFLHGITGAGNNKYRQFIQHSIDVAPKPVLSEKRFSHVYRGIDAELEDWAPIQLWQAFSQTGRMLLHPGALASVSLLAFLEHVRKGDRFSDGLVSHLGDSPSFHLIDPDVRRAICGFPDPATYFKIGITRYLAPFSPHVSAIHVPDPDWAWLEAVEPNATISLRSLHMIEFAAAYAIEKGVTELSVFVGETHNTDIEWLATVLGHEDWLASWSPAERAVIDNTAGKARALAATVATGGNLNFERAAFETSFMSGALLSLTALCGIAAGVATLAAKAIAMSGSRQAHRDSASA
jgi:hypothetical protein